MHTCQEGVEDQEEYHQGKEEKIKYSGAKKKNGRGQHNFLPIFKRILLDYIEQQIGRINLREIPEEFLKQANTNFHESNIICYKSNLNEPIQNFFKSSYPNQRLMKSKVDDPNTKSEYQRLINDFKSQFEKGQELHF